MTPPNRPTLVLTAVALLLAATSALAQKPTQKLYRWTDDQGVVHYGDQVPPRYATRDRVVLNNEGVIVGFHRGALTPAEKAERAAAAEKAKATKAAEERTERHDQMLLQTYRSVADIEQLRDRRLESLDAQIKVTQVYLDGLNQQLAKLDQEAANYSKPPKGRPAREVPASLTSEISDMQSTIASYEADIQRTRDNQTAARQSFARDIARFKELKSR